MQATQHILLVKPASFGFNTETAASNSFQQLINLEADYLQQKVAAEFDAFASTLRSKGVNVLVIEDSALPLKPDAVFPNNWVSYHADGTIILYPMCAPNRRLEKRADIIDTIQMQFEVSNIIDLSEHETANRFLEGTGSIIFDHINNIAYACISPRTDKLLFEELAIRLNYKPICFGAFDKQGMAIYHTNVMMCIAEKFAVICLESIGNEAEKAMVTNSLLQTGHQIIAISFDQMNQFAGNMLALKSNTGNDLLALSQTAFDSLTANQQATIAQYCELVPLAIPTIEAIGGGSARCMIAEIFLPVLPIVKN
jgi:hypothetical protein